MQHMKAIVFGIIILFFGAASSSVLSVDVADLDSDITNIVNGGGNQPPVAIFNWSPPDPMVDEPITFDASDSYDPDGVIEIYAWDFENDGTEDAWGKIVTHAYDNCGVYTVRLMVQDNNGTSSNCTEDVIVLEEAIIAGLIETKRSEGNFTYISGKLLYFYLIGVHFLFSGEEVVIHKDCLGYVGPCSLMDYLGYKGPCPIIGFFKACVIS